MIEITIPILNEEKTLDHKIRELYLYICMNLHDFEPIQIILVDNGSTDNTNTIAKKLTYEFASIKYLRLEEKGVGLALKTSWSASKSDIIGYIDLDLATDLRYLKPFFEILANDRADIVTGSRLMKGSKVIGRSTLRSFTSQSFNIIIKNIFNTSITDGMCGFKFLKREYIDQLIKTGAQSDGWFFATELLIIGEYLGYRIIDYPVEWKDDNDSKVKIGKLAVEYLKAMFILKNRLLKMKKLYGTS